MKINEIVNEGWVSSLGHGLAKGVSDIVAPGAYNKSRQDLAVKSASKGGDVEHKGLKYRWLGNQWGVINPDTGKISPASKDMQTRLNFWAQRNPAGQKMQQTQQTTQQTPPTEAQSPQDLVDRLFKLHPDWAPEVAKEILTRSQVTGNK